MEAMTMKIQVITFSVPTDVDHVGCICTHLASACAHLPGLIGQHWSVNSAERTVGGLLRWQDASVYLAGARHARAAVRGVYPQADPPVGRSLSVADLPGYPCAGEYAVSMPQGVHGYAGSFDPCAA